MSHFPQTHCDPPTAHNSEACCWLAVPQTSFPGPLCVGHDFPHPSKCPQPQLRTSSAVLRVPGEATAPLIPSAHHPGSCCWSGWLNTCTTSQAAPRECEPARGGTGALGLVSLDHCVHLRVFSCLKTGYFVLQAPQKMTNETRQTNKRSPAGCAGQEASAAVRRCSRSCSSSPLGTLTHARPRTNVWKDVTGQQMDSAVSPGPPSSQTRCWRWPVSVGQSWHAHPHSDSLLLPQET